MVLVRRQVRSSRRSSRTAAGEDVGHTEASRAAAALHHGRPRAQHDRFVFRSQNLFVPMQFHALVSDGDMWALFLFRLLLGRGRWLFFYEEKRIYLILVVGSDAFRLVDR